MQIYCFSVSKQTLFTFFYFFSSVECILLDMKPKTHLNGLCIEGLQQMVNIIHYKRVYCYEQTSIRKPLDPP